MTSHLCQRSPHPHYQNFSYHGHRFFVIINIKQIYRHLHHPYWTDANLYIICWSLKLCLINVNTQKESVMMYWFRTQGGKCIYGCHRAQTMQKLASSRLESVNFDGKNQRREGTGNEEH